MIKEGFLPPHIGTFIAVCIFLTVRRRDSSGKD